VTRLRLGTLPVVLVALALACHHTLRPSADRAGESAVVLLGPELERAGGALLEAMRARVPNMRVLRRERACPIVTLRGRRTLYASEAPLIYVDGTEINDTCILDQIHVREVDRVEVYAGGITTPSGYQSSPNGVILIFLKG
jgi:hypothetical protein